MVLYVVVGLFLLLAQCLATPYHAPLQGVAGGKKTLVLMDDLVSASMLLTCTRYNSQLIIPPDKFNRKKSPSFLLFSEIYRLAAMC